MEKTGLKYTEVLCKTAKTLPKSETLREPILLRDPGSHVFRVLRLTFQGTI